MVYSERNTVKLAEVSVVKDATAALFSNSLELLWRQGVQRRRDGHMVRTRFKTHSHQTAMRASVESTHSTVSELGRTLIIPRTCSSEQSSRREIQTPVFVLRSKHNIFLFTYSTKL